MEREKKLRTMQRPKWVLGKGRADVVMGMVLATWETLTGSVQSVVVLEMPGLACLDGHRSSVKTMA